MSLFLDPRTTLACTAGYSLVISLVTFLFWQRSQRQPAVLALAIGGLLDAAAGLLYLAPLDLDPALISISAKLLIQLAALHVLISIERFYKHSSHYSLPLGLALVFIPLLLFIHEGLAHSALARHAIFSLGACLLWGLIAWRLWQAEQDSPRAGKSLASALAMLTLLLELARLALALSAIQPDIEVAGQRQNLLLLMTQWSGYGVVVCQLYLVYERAMDQLLQQSRSDSLTRLLNRRSFDEEAVAAFRLAQRERRALSLIVLDLDHFKSINDRHGHLAGDQALTALADCLRRQARQTDLIGRHGGEEFCILLPDTGREQAGQVAERLRAAIARIELPLPDAGAQLRFTASLGVACLNSSHASLESLFCEADAMLYQAKHHGRDKVMLSALPAAAA
ncbi:MULTISPECIES: GGDEF domain-containing protein [Chromobacterium]|uniref:GGDEF domain-containing protein n=1 Tax=Chromobacterium TaxID=535 RepID=UPI000DEEC5BD|nr:MULTISPECIES: GGDEF domain-containing protein [Chromobacterium]QOZ84394.1 diguanylate cyclase [Chromobacterium sp. Rain0013]WON84577.1 GGDEF domain-containing protein [Chromobacterium haemolyticum]